MSSVGSLFFPSLVVPSPGALIPTDTFLAALPILGMKPGTFLQSLAKGQGIP